MLGIRTRGRRMVGADKTTELWRPPIIHNHLQSQGWLKHNYIRYSGTRLPVSFLKHLALQVWFTYVANKKLNALNLVHT